MKKQLAKLAENQPTANRTKKRLSKLNIDAASYVPQEKKMSIPSSSLSSGSIPFLSLSGDSAEIVSPRHSHRSQKFLPVVPFESYPEHPQHLIAQG